MKWWILSAQKQRSTPVKKISKQAKGNLLNALTILCVLGIVLYLSASSGDLGDAWATLLSADVKWILAALGSWVVFTIFEGMGMHVFIRWNKIKIKLSSSILVGLIGTFYSSVTPAATGGQPMQVFAFKKRGVPAGISSSGLAIKFFTFQTALLITTAVMWILHADMVQPCIEKGKALVILGLCLNSFSVVAVLLLAINRNIVRWIITLLIQLGSALRIVKDVAGTSSKAEAALEDFSSSVDMVTHHPKQLFKLILLAVPQVLGLMSIVYCVYRALGLDTFSYFEILTLQLLLYLGASFIPTPGASGAQEGGFYIFFQHVFPSQGLLWGALLLWRFFTYYLNLIAGFIAVLIDGTHSMRKIKKQKKNAPDSSSSPPTPKGDMFLAQNDSGSPESADSQTESIQ